MVESPKYGQKKIVGLTGGIGSGKTTVANMFAALGVPVYIADVEAKKLSDSSEEIRNEIIALLGKGAYNGTLMDRGFVAERVFKDSGLLQRVNGIIHPRVAEHFLNWAAAQDAPYVIKEAAILFENGGYKNCDLVILVTAPKKVRIARVMARDSITKSAVEERMAHQWSDEKKRQMADFIIENTDLKTTQKSVSSIHQYLRDSPNL
jgi:dephospho-CoA kinase